MSVDSELSRRSQEIISLAAECRHVLDLSRATGWSMEAARHANATLNLGLPEAGLRSPGPRSEGRANPKPVAKKGGGK